MAKSKSAIQKGHDTICDRCGSIKPAHRGWCTSKESKPKEANITQTFSRYGLKTHGAWCTCIDCSRGRHGKNCICSTCVPTNSSSYNAEIRGDQTKGTDFLPHHKNCLCDACITKAVAKKDKKCDCGTTDPSRHWNWCKSYGVAEYDDDGGAGMDTWCEVADQYCTWTPNIRSRCKLCKRRACNGCSFRTRAVAPYRARICHECLTNNGCEDVLDERLDFLAELFGYDYRDWEEPVKELIITRQEIL